MMLTSLLLGLGRPVDPLMMVDDGAAALPESDDICLSEFVDASCAEQAVQEESAGVRRGAEELARAVGGEI